MGIAFIHLPKFLYMWLICIPPCPLSHSQGQDKASWHRERGGPSTRATAQISWGSPQHGKRKITMKVYYTIAPHRVEGIRRVGGVPPCYCPSS